MVVLGKALGNGYAISAVLGKKEIMGEAQNTFISSSYWTERTGFAAAIETINQFEGSNVINHLVEVGGYFRNKMKYIFESLDVKIDGMLTVPVLVFGGDDGLSMKTYFTQEMLKRGFLASSLIYTCLSHSEKIIDNYAVAVADVIDQIQEKYEDVKISELLDGPVCHSGFNRLT